MIGFRVVRQSFLIATSFIAGIFAAIWLGLASQITPTSIPQNIQAFAIGYAIAGSFGIIFLGFTIVYASYGILKRAFPNSRFVTWAKNWVDNAEDDRETLADLLG